MSLAELKQRVVRDLRGAWTRARTEPNGSRAQTTYQTNRASRCENVRFENGRIIGRDGFLPGSATAGRVTAIFQLIAFDATAGNINFVITFENGAIVLRDQIFGGTVTAETISGALGATFVDTANRAYGAFYNSLVQGASEVRVIQPLLPSFPSTKAFMGPMSTTPSAAESGAGFCTAGAHSLAYIVTSRSGFQGKPSPYSGAVFTPITFTVSADKTIRLTINPTAWPDDALEVSAVMSTVENPAKYFLVPDSTVSVIPGAPYTVNIDISIDDPTLEADGTLITDNLSYLTQMGGVGPIQPYNIAILGRRLAYFTGNRTYISDQDDPEVITGDLNALEMPGQRQVVTACQIRGVNYFFGPKWTWATVDNDDSPATWATPYSVGQSLGTTCLHGVEVATTGDRAWVANEQGLWDFDGGYATNPVSYMNQPEWNRINWLTARPLLRIVDDTVRQCVSIFVPLDGAADLTHKITYDYSRGRGPMEVDFSLDRIKAGDLSSAAMVRDWTTQQSRLWVGPAEESPADRFLIESRTALDDDGVAFEAIWESGRVYDRRGQSNSVDVQVQAVEADVKGVGYLLSKIYGMGRVEFVDLQPAENISAVNLAELPSDNVELGCDIISPDVTVEFKTSSAGERMDLGNFTVFGNPWLANR